MSAAAWTAFDEGYLRAYEWAQALAGGAAMPQEVARVQLGPARPPMPPLHRWGSPVTSDRTSNTDLVLPDRWPGRPCRHGSGKPGLQRVEEGRGAEGREAELAPARHRRHRRDEPAADRDRKWSDRIALVRGDRSASARSRAGRRARRAVPAVGPALAQARGAMGATALRVRALPGRRAGPGPPDARRAGRTCPAAGPAPLRTRASSLAAPRAAWHRDMPTGSLERPEQVRPDILVCCHILIDAIRLHLEHETNAFGHISSFPVVASAPHRGIGERDTTIHVQDVPVLFDARAGEAKCSTASAMSAGVTFTFSAAAPGSAPRAGPRGCRMPLRAPPPRRAPDPETLRTASGFTVSTRIHPGRPPRRGSGRGAEKPLWPLNTRRRFAGRERVLRSDEDGTSLREPGHAAPGRLRVRRGSSRGRGCRCFDPELERRLLDRSLEAIPALETTMSMPPKARTASLKASCTDASSSTSATADSPEVTELVRKVGGAVGIDVVRRHMRLGGGASATAPPMPPAAPVTSTRPCSSRGGGASDSLYSSSGQYSTPNDSPSSRETNPPSAEATFMTLIARWYRSRASRAALTVRPTDTRPIPCRTMTRGLGSPKASSLGTVEVVDLVSLPVGDRLQRALLQVDPALERHKDGPPPRMHEVIGAGGSHL